VYVGRIVAIARSVSGANAVLYRVSSRSFPNRAAVERNGRIAIVPRPGHEADLLASPYISYTCLRIAGDWAVASNGHHTDPIAEKLGDGVPIRDALAGTLLALDYERDDLRTPRIAAAVPLRGDRGWLAIVRHDGLEVKELELAAGRAVYLATYGANEIRDDRRLAFDAKDAPGAARVAVAGAGFAELEKPVTSAAALAVGGRFTLATHLV
jgi:IMP cyclohydrolase